LVGGGVMGILLLGFLLPLGRKRVSQVGSNQQLDGYVEGLEPLLDRSGRLELRILGTGIGDHRDVEGIFRVIRRIVNMQAGFLVRRKFLRQVLEEAVSGREAGTGAKDAPAMRVMQADVPGAASSHREAAK